MRCCGGHGLLVRLAWLSSIGVLVSAVVLMASNMGWLSHMQENPAKILRFLNGSLKNGEPDRQGVVQSVERNGSLKNGEPDRPSTTQSVERTGLLKNGEPARQSTTQSVELVNQERSIIPLSDDVLDLRRSWRINRSCNSPEFFANGTFGNCPSNESVFSQTSNVTCGLCSQNKYAVALQKLAARIKGAKERECYRLVVYGVVFGNEYYRKYQQGTWTSMMNYNLGKGKITKPSDVRTGHPLHKNHSRCFITFVLYQSLQAYPLFPKTQSMDGLDLILPIPAEVLPYKNHRRNTKIFKMLGSFLFPWAERLIWQDSEKFRRVTWDGYRPSDYFAYFSEVIEKRNVCAAFTQAPRHENYFGNYSGHVEMPRLDLHCRAIVDSTRRNATDSQDALSKQCLHYYNHTNVKALNHVHSRLIDSAFIVWDQRSSHCRQFNAQLGCTWFDEINCYSDRDQVSFPVALTSMGVHEEVHDNFTWFQHDRILVDSLGHPAVELVSPSCHWYYHHGDVNLCVRPGGHAKEEDHNGTRTTICLKHKPDLCLYSGRGGPPAAYQRIQVTANTNDPNGRFEVRAGDSTIRMARDQSLCFKVFYGNFRDHTKIILYTCNGVQHEKWFFQARDGTIRTKAAPDMCLTVAPGMKLGSLIYLFRCSAGTHQQFITQLRK